jgi:hypothetical protein
MYKKASHESVGLFFIPITSNHEYTNKSKGLKRSTFKGKVTEMQLQGKVSKSFVYSNSRLSKQPFYLYHTFHHATLPPINQAPFITISLG